MRKLVDEYAKALSNSQEDYIFKIWYEEKRLRGSTSNDFWTCFEDTLKVQTIPVI